MKSIVIIPARYDSQRLPGKVLKKDTGKYLIQHVYERACQAKLPDAVYIATDDNRVAKACEEFYARYIMTSKEHRTGTDRIAEAVRMLFDPKSDIIVNVQGDLPEVIPEHIDILIENMEKNTKYMMGVLRTKFNNDESITNSNVIKTIVTQNNRAIYFTRGVTPYRRDYKDGLSCIPDYYKHLGIYAFRRTFLLSYVLMPQTPLEKIEKLEQLRAIEYDYPILSTEVDGYYEGIDSPEQYKKFVEQYKKSLLKKEK